MQERLRLALQKSGRLSEESLELLETCGIRCSSEQRSAKLLNIALNFPMEIFYLRDDDIPGFVEDGMADVGIVGENIVVESGKQITLVEKLGFARCRLSLAVPKEMTLGSLGEFNQKSIATSYPRILGDFLRKNSVEARIHEMSGSVEAGPALGVSDAICDLVSSGSTLAANGLREFQTIFESEAVLIRAGLLSERKEQVLKSLCFRIKAVRKGRQSRYVVLNAPEASLDKIIQLLPGIKSPTIVPLAMKGWCAVHSVLSEDEFWEITESLKAAGAQGILVVPIEQMIV